MIVASGTALADPISFQENGGELTAYFGASHTAGTFTDTFTFDSADLKGWTDTTFWNLSYKADNTVTFSSASINGIDITISSLPLPPKAVSYSTGGIAPTYLSGEIILTISGTSGKSGSYSGIINLSPVPEPATYGMMLGGLAMLGFMARRRKQD
jgi:hypothetical protein